MELISEFLVKDLGLIGGLSVAINLFILVQWVRGELVSRKQVDQVQKMADTFEHGMNTAMSNQSRTADALTQIDSLVQTFKHFIESLPKVGGKQ